MLECNEYGITVLYVGFHYPTKFSEDAINSTYSHGTTEGDDLTY